MGFIVAIDGPAGAGKSTVARLVARRLGFALVDTGAIYRCVAHAALERQLALDDEEALGALARSLKIEFRFEDDLNRIFLDGADVTDRIRTPECSRTASRVSSRPPVRAALLDLQRSLAATAPSGAVLEGRDIGTVVFPDAPLKIFLTASAEERARRRYDELRAKGSGVEFADVLNDQMARDHEDTSREVAPLKPAEDAVLYDTSGRSTDEVVSDLVQLARVRMERETA